MLPATYLNMMELPNSGLWTKKQKELIWKDGGNPYKFLNLSYSTRYIWEDYHQPRVMMRTKCSNCSGQYLLWSVWTVIRPQCGNLLILSPYYVSQDGRMDESVKHNNGISLIAPELIKGWAYCVSGAGKGIPVRFPVGAPG